MDIMLRVKPHRYMANIVIRTATGSDMLMITVLLTLRRNTKRTHITRQRPWSIVVLSSERVSRISVLSSLMIIRFISSGR